MKTSIFETETEAAAYAAQGAAKILSEKPTALFCLAAGHSSLPFFKAAIAMNLDFSGARFVEVDEWLELPLDAPGSCAGFLHINFFSKINAQKENICLFDSMTTDSDAECRRITDRIAAWGGIDYLLLGMGLNGHLALNEPGCDLNGSAHVSPLAKATLETAPKYFGGKMPPIKSGITLGLADIKAARLIHLLVLGNHKQEVYQRLRSYTKPNSDLPASALLDTKQTELILDRAAAGTSS